MKVNISSLKFKADVKLLDFIQERVDKLGHFNNEILGGDVVLRVHNSSDQANKNVEIKLLMKGKELFAEKTSESFESAVDQSVEALRRQLKRLKDKRK
jgi:putative sigma-54 modulation protein